MKDFNFFRREFIDFAGVAVVITKNDNKLPSNNRKKLPAVPISNVVRAGIITEG